jgi:hypothetical protein
LGSRSVARQPPPPHGNNTTNQNGGRALLSRMLRFFSDNFGHAVCEHLRNFCKSLSHPKSRLVAYSTRFNSVFAQSRTPSKAGSIPSAGRLYRSERIRREAEWECQAAQLGDSRRGLPGGRSPKMPLHRSHRAEGKSGRQIAILNGSRPFLLALAPVHPFALVAERLRQRLISAVDVLRLFETWHLRYLSTMQRGPCSHLSA